MRELTEEEKKDFTNGWSKVTLQVIKDQHGFDWYSPRCGGCCSKSQMCEECAKQLMKNNGLHPDFIPSFLRDEYVTKKDIKILSEYFALTYVIIPES